ncbi:MAG: alpha/beta fold hydrolase [Patescibacteria group bacterium]
MYKASDASKKNNPDAQRGRGSDLKRRKKYVLIEFPYPSGEGLHMGHLRPYVAGDVYSRYSRMKGYEVMYPIGWDAFGLPAENYAIKNKVHPSVSTAKNIANAKRQLQSWGMGFDWSREVTTTDPNYYKWTQWIFLQFFKAGLAYEATGKINWCPKDKTGLANEEVINGHCERCGTKVVEKEMKQWYLRITAYAEKLLEGLKKLDWPQGIKTQQENWIGKSVGALLDFEIKDGVAPTYVLLHGYTGSPSANFFPWLKKELERRGAKVYTPKLPNSDDPRVYDQVAEVLKSIPFNKNTVLLGHSLGGVVAMKVLEQLKKPVRKTILVSSFTQNRFLDDPFRSYAFDWKFNAEKIKSNAGAIHILRDTTDDTVPQFQAENIKNLIGGTIFNFVANAPHACAEKEPEILRHCVDSIQVFTTRPDTLFGATYVVLAPEHPFVENLKSQISNHKEVEAYIKKTKSKSEDERLAASSTISGQEKTGVELKGVKAINPATKEEIPIFIADYVLGTYGTGAIMAVPAHDERDRQFAEKFKLPIANKPLISIAEAIKKFGQSKIQYKLRDWVFSRQRYWGEPIPLIHCANCGVVAVPEKDLPVKLPKVKKYEPTGTGESPLAAIKEWVNIKCPQCGGKALRETNTMPQWAGSSWYYLRYADPKNKKEFASKSLLKCWLPVDVYFGGMEHTTLHLLYSRFWHKFLYDKKYVPTSEPYAKRVPHGIILGADGEKMSKSRGNIVSPDEIIKEFGADALRMYELFLGPHEATVSWNSRGILGVSRFLERVWKLGFGFVSRKDGVSLAQPLARPLDSRPHSSNFVGDHARSGSETLFLETNLNHLLHKAIKKVTEDIESFHYNTAISALMILLNEMEKNEKSIITNHLLLFLKLLAPFAPHLAEELWMALGNKESVHQSEWPKFDPKLIKEETFTLIIQINGKVRDQVEAKIGISESEAGKLAIKQERMKQYLAENKPKKVIFVPNRLINFVI